MKAFQNSIELLIDIFPTSMICRVVDSGRLDAFASDTWQYTADLCLRSLLLLPVRTEKLSERVERDVVYVTFLCELWTSRLRC